MRAQISDTDGLTDPELLDAIMTNKLLLSKFPMAIGNTNADNIGCELFEPEPDLNDGIEMGATIQLAVRMT